MRRRRQQRWQHCSCGRGVILLQISVGSTILTDCKTRFLKATTPCNPFSCRLGSRPLDSKFCPSLQVPWCPPPTHAAAFAAPDGVSRAPRVRLRSSHARRVRSAVSVIRGSQSPPHAREGAPRWTLSGPAGLRRGSGSPVGLRLGLAASEDARLRASFEHSRVPRLSAACVFRRLETRACTHRCLQRVGD